MKVNVGRFSVSAIRTGVAVAACYGAAGNLFCANLVFFMSILSFLFALLIFVATCWYVASDKTVKLSRFDWVDFITDLFTIVVCAGAGWYWCAFAFFSARASNALFRLVLR